MNPGMQVEQSKNGQVINLPIVSEEEDHSAKHCERVLSYSLAIADELKLSSDEKQHLRCAAMLHDLGKIRVSPRMLESIGEISQEELTAMRQYSVMTRRILEGIGELHGALPAIRHHYERFDGQGPEGLSGQNIPLSARIISVAEAYDHLTSNLPWRDAISHDQAMTELRCLCNTQFDPDVVHALEQSLVRKLPKAA